MHYLLNDRRQKLLRMFSSGTPAAVRAAVTPCDISFCPITNASVFAGSPLRAFSLVAANTSWTYPFSAATPEPSLGAEKHSTTSGDSQEVILGSHGRSTAPDSIRERIGLMPEPVAKNRTF